MACIIAALDADGGSSSSVVVDVVMDSAVDTSATFVCDVTRQLMAAGCL
jgi:hypothetical protein